jgi:hypothetical protein
VSALPGNDLAGLLPVLLDDLPEVIRQVVALLREEWPDYAEFLDDDAESVLAIAQSAVEQLLALAPGGHHPRGAHLQGSLELFEELGRIEWREGRPLSSLLAAYRAGARVTWQHMSRAAVRRDVPSGAVALLAEAVFVFVEDLSNASARGYVEEQLAASAERERLRAELAELLLSPRATAPGVQAAAAAAGWPLPATAALVVVPPELAGDLSGRLDGTALPVRRSELAGCVVPDPHAPGRRARLASALAGLGAVVSGSVPLTSLPAVLPVATEALRLHAQGVLPADPVFLDEHYDALIVHHDARLLRLLEEQVLAPLAGEPAGARARLVDTLAAWLATMGDRQEMARELHVHPQTVRYRMGRLRELFGPSLDDPRTRARLLLVLGWRPATRAPVSGATAPEPA